MNKYIMSIPAWVLQTVVGAILTAALTWGSWTSISLQRHESRIAVSESRANTVDKSIDEIKQSQLRIEDKLDRILEGRKP